MSRSLGKKIARGVLWSLLGVVALVAMIPVALYIPPVQDFARRIAVSKASESTGMDIAVGYLRLKFPLRLELRDVGVVEAGGDTMVTAGRVGLDVKLLPLLKLDVQVGHAELDSVFYQLGNADSLMWLRARVRRADLDASGIALKEGKIDVDRAVVDGVDVSLRMLPDTAAVPADTAAGTPWLINARSIELRDVNYRMSMLPTIDSLGAHLDVARLEGGTVDMARRYIHAGSLAVDSVLATYLTPSAAWLAANPQPAVAPTPPTPPSEQWVVTADRVRLTGRSATYAVRGARPMRGLDMNYLQARDIIIEVDSFFNKATSVTVPLKRLSATERCGLKLDASGTFMMDSTLMQAIGFDITTMLSSFRIDGAMGVGDIAADPDLPIRLNAMGSLAMADVVTAMPSLAPMIRQLPAGDLEINADIDGTPGGINIYNLSLNMPRLLTLEATGRIENVMDPARIAGDLTLDGSLRNLNSLKPTLLDARLRDAVNLPDITLSGTVDYSPGLVEGTLTATTGGGDVAAEVFWNDRPQQYDVNIETTNFPVDHFMPGLGVGRVTMALSANGHGYDPMKPTTAANVNLNVAHAAYKGTDYRDVTLHANLVDCHATGALISRNDGADLHAAFSALISPDGYTVDLDGDINDLNLVKLGLSPTVNDGSLDIVARGVYFPLTGDFNVDATVADIDWRLPGMEISTPSVVLSASNTDSLLTASIVNGDLRADLRSRCSLDTFMVRATAVADIALKQIAERQIDVEAISRALPAMDVNAAMGTQNVVAEYLKESSDAVINSLAFNASNDSLLSFDARATGISVGSTRLDTVAVDAVQHGKFLVYDAYANNRPGTFDDFAYVSLNGYLAQDRLSAVFRQNNIKGEKGFQLGLRARMADSTVTVNLVPYTPTIAYQQWEVNKDNFVSYNFVERHLDANLALTNDKSYLKLFTDHVEGDTTHRQEDIVLQVAQIKLQDWLSISPFAPPIKGDLSADMHFRWDNEAITGHGTVNLADMYYGRDRVGTFDLELDVARDNSGALRANLDMMVDSVRTLTASGVLNDSTAGSPMKLDLSIIRFPLAVANPFLPEGVASLSGTLNGTLDVTGDFERPNLNGYIAFDSTAVKVNMIGTSFAFDNERIPVDSNVVRFNAFDIRGCNDNPLTVSGSVDLHSLTDIGIDLGMKARNMMIINSSRPKGADAYGKGYIDLDATARGNLGVMMVNADLKLLSGSNVTYVMSTAATQLTSQSVDDMVKFVQFNDSSQVAVADSLASSGMALFVDAALTIQPGTTVAVDISADGKNKASLQTTASLDYSLNPMNDGRLTGRININGGFVRYTPPFMSEKNFTFQEGSYVAFNGDMLNPILNVKAVDQMKANVTQEGQNSRLVNFDVILTVTNTLENMNVAFDLTTNDDITVQNELTSMSPEQRANQAMNLLLYNLYTGAGTKATANLSGNPLYSFLESQLNSWVANNVRGVDISFGIDQYNKTTDGSSSTTTSYSYRVSKTLFNDRFKIIVGGNYSTDADADENFSQNLINDISFEYMLNRSGSMYVRIFRHTGYESILEGEVTQTGVGFVLKRKLSSLRDLFRFGRPKSTTNSGK